MAYLSKAVAAWIAVWRAGGPERRALLTVVEMSDARLLDLGIERHDLHLATENARRDHNAFVGASLIRPFAKVFAVLRGPGFPAAFKDWEREA
mgnify:CR=1 FL=1|jgi:hypothetical protein